MNSIANQSVGGGVSSGVMQAIQNAATRTGVDFSYLLKKASQESGFDPTAKASTSSASGLFQFTKQTWLHMVKQYG
ncbi:MAG: transglycosylase SLT domain-containing protein, partial [Alphaproteobacteria bacterium]